MKEKCFSKIFLFLLAICMIFTALPASAFILVQMSDTLGRDSFIISPDEGKVLLTVGSPVSVFSIWTAEGNISPENG